MCVTLAPSWAQGLQSLLSSTITYFHLQPLGEREVVEPRGQEPRLWSHRDTSSSPHSHFLSCCCSVAKSRLSLCDPMSCSMSGFPVLHCLLEFAQIHFHWVSDAIQPSYLLSPASPPAFNLSQHQGLFQWGGSLHQVAKALNFSFSISPSSEYSGLISFRIDWFHLLTVQGTLKSFLQHHRLKALILWLSDLFMVQLSHPYMTTGEIITVTIWAFVDKVMSLLLNTLSGLVIAFLPRSKHLLI